MYLPQLLSASPTHPPYQQLTLDDLVKEGVHCLKPEFITDYLSKVFWTPVRYLKFNVHACTRIYAHARPYTCAQGDDSDLESSYLPQVKGLLKR